MTTVTSVRNIKALLRFTSDDPTRPYFAGVFADPAGYLVATDGHIMMALRTHQPFNGDGFIIPADVLATAAKASKPLAEVSIDRDAITYPAKGRDIKMNYTPLSGLNYPHWRAVVPTTCNGEPAWFDCALLERIRKAREDLTISKARRTYVFVWHNGKGPAIVQTNDDDVLMLVMPLRVEELDTQPAGEHVARFLGIEGEQAAA